MSTPVAVSVIVPAFNAAQSIDVQLQALSEQRDAPAWELIVADNGSADGTVARAHSWTKRFEDLIIVDASVRRGPGAARNIGAARARGEKLLFCDADDAANPQWIANLAHALDLAHAASGARAYDALNAKRFGPADWPAPVFAKPPLSGLAAASSHNLGVRRSAFEAIGGFDERLSTAEDVDLSWRLQLAGFSFAAAPGAIMQIRRRTGIAAVFRQARTYGRGDRVLGQRFAAVQTGRSPSGEPLPVIDAVSAPSATSSGPAVPEDGGGRRRMLPDLEFRAHRLGHFLGSHFGRDPVPPLTQEELR